MLFPAVLKPWCFDLTVCPAGHIPKSTKRMRRVQIFLRENPPKEFKLFCSNPKFFKIQKMVIPKNQTRVTLIPIIKLFYSSSPHKNKYLDNCLT